MVFTSIEFGVFLSVFFLLYWFVFNKNFKKQNTLTLIGSYIFYGWWDWRFLILIFASSLVDFFVGQFLSKTENKYNKKLLLSCSLIFNLGLLFTFKYFNFFIDSFKTVFNLADQNSYTLYLILPVGISFYTLQTLSYTIDVYDGRLKPSKNFVGFFAYVSFFPQLVAGPIERATNLLPQFEKKRVFSYEKATDGMRQILWGFFKKMVIADNCGVYVDKIFLNPEDFNGSTLFIGLILLVFQFYCDFSGYSDIAIGSGKLLGFNLSKNFDFPLFSRNSSEFWKKWHITLIEWFRFYIVNRLKGFTKNKILRNVFIVFLISGLWHGANYTFIIWGFLHALTFIPLIYGKRTKYRGKVAEGKLFPSLKEFYLMIKTVLIFTLPGAFFRSETTLKGFLYYKNFFSFSFFNMPLLPNKTIIFSVFMLIVIEWLQREKNHGLEINTKIIHPFLRWMIYFILILLILFFAIPEKPFVYFQF